MECFRHKYHINITITATCIRQPFTISCMLKFTYMLKASKVGSVRNTYIGLTEEERQDLTVARYLRSITTQGRDIIQTKQSYSGIHSHRKMHRLLTTLSSNNNATTNALGILQRLVAGLIMPFGLNILNCFGVIPEVGLFLLWSFKRFTALEAFMEKLIEEERNKWRMTAALPRKQSSYEMQYVEAGLSFIGSFFDFAVCKSSMILP
ncbi:hypothetical protein T03_86 [Trichinella britovi]|uniref:Uncharacterized protein n=1 Tax=Trichinella britovi TaxID=45882 RepID=A0A0V1CPV9_TRIBR|nr:hypothetical protein T03_86 [Trichinella britovi]